MLVRSFQLQLREQLFPRLVCFGKFDGEHLTLAAVISGGRILLHNPAAAASGDECTTLLHIKKDILALAAGCLDARSGRDLLFIGTGRDVRAFDVHENCDLFVHDVPDGVGCLLVAPQPGGGVEPLLFIGGAAAVVGLNGGAQERFWTACSDVVSALAAADADGGGARGLVAGSHACDIQVLREGSVVAERREADQVVALCEVAPGHIAYALANGTVGVYAGLRRVWRVKSKNAVHCIAAHDFNSDGVPEVISGWANGKLEVRAIGTGEVVFREQLPAAVVHIAVVDLRGDGCPQVVVTTADGGVKGFAAEGRAGSGATGAATDVQPPTAAARDNDVLEQAVTATQQHKRELEQELRALQSNLGVANDGAGPVQDIIPPDTAVSGDLRVDGAARRLELVVATNNATVVKAVVLFAEHLFEGESLCVTPAAHSQRVAVPISPANDAAVDILVKVAVGSATSKVYHVFDLDATLPRFAMYHQQPLERLPRPRGAVHFDLQHPPARLLQWLRESLNFSGDLDAAGAASAGFLLLRDGSAVTVDAEPAGGGARIAIRADSMAVAGDVFQALVQEVGGGDVAAAAEFDAEFAAFEATARAGAGASAAAQQLHAEVADATNTIKSLVVKAEDARLLSNARGMLRNYRLLRDVNGALLSEHEKRAQQHAELQAALKEVNRMIQSAARLRHGRPRADLVAACRAAVQRRNVDLLLALLRNGA